VQSVLGPAVEKIGVISGSLYLLTTLLCSPCIYLLCCLVATVYLGE